MTPEAPPPPWQTPARPARRSQLSREGVVKAAMDVVDSEGIDALSMRRVAAELGTGAASLYWYVRNRDELLTLMIDEVAGEIPLPEPDPRRWKEQLKDLGRGLRRALVSHRDIAKATMGRIPLGPNTMRVGEWVHGLLRSAGLPDRAVALTLDLFSLYVGAVAMEEGGGDPPLGDNVAPDAAFDMLRDYFRSLPPESFPNTIALADQMVDPDPDERFEFGMDVLISGLEMQAKRLKQSGRTKK